MIVPREPFAGLDIHAGDVLRLSGCPQYSQDASGNLLRLKEDVEGLFTVISFTPTSIKVERCDALEVLMDIYNKGKGAPC